MRLAQSRKAAIAAILLILGIGFGAVARLAASAEQTSYFGRSSAPQFAQVTEGRTYLLSVHGGVNALTDQGLNAASLACSYLTPSNNTLQSLKLTAEAADTKATNAVASFLAPLTGAIRVQCPSYAGAVYLDGADNAPFDLAGLYLLLCIGSLFGAVVFGVSAARTAASAPLDPVPLDPVPLDPAQFEPVTSDSAGAPTVPSP